PNIPATDPIPEYRAALIAFAATPLETATFVYCHPLNRATAAPALLSIFVTTIHSSVFSIITVGSFISTSVELVESSSTNSLANTAPLGVIAEPKVKIDVDNNNVLNKYFFIILTSVAKTRKRFLYIFRII